PEINNLGLGPRRKDRIRTKPVCLEIISRNIEQQVCPHAVSFCRTHRQRIADRKPRRVAVDQRTVLIEQDAFDISQQVYSDRSCCRCRTRPAVALSRPAASSLPSTTGRSELASSLPSSTPHWSNALMPNS